MIDWLAITVAFAIIAILVGIFGFVAWKINMSDPLMSIDTTGKKEDSNQILDPTNDKRKREKPANDATKKKRKDKKKNKRSNKEEEEDVDDQQPHQHKVKFKEPTTQTSEETDNEREESEQDSSTTTPIVETSSKVRKRNKNKGNSSTHIEGILVNKDEKSPVTKQAAPIPHPILATTIPKDEVELAKQHNHPGKPHTKPSQPSAKQTPTAPVVPIKKTTPSSTNNNQAVQKQQQPEQQEQPFTTVGGNRHKTVTPPAQQNKPANITTSTANNTNGPATTPAALPVPPVQQTAPVQLQVQQQPQPQRQQTEKPTQTNGINANQIPMKQSSAATAIPLTKISDIVKTLPTSQTVVTELMLALDAVSLSTDELDIIMHKIANKQSVLKKDWTKLQHGQKVDPQAHIGQILDESARAFDEDMKNNAMKRIQELSDERNNDKRRINDLIKETTEKNMDIQVLHAQLSALQQPQQQFQSFQSDFKRLTEENIQLKQRLTQHQQHFQQQQFAPLGVMNNNGDPSNIQLRVLSEQVKKLSVDNGNLEKQLNAKESLIKDTQKERDDLYRSNQQLLQKAQESQKQFQLNEDKLLKELNECRTIHMNQLNEYKGRLEQLESDNEKLRRENVTQKEAMQTIASNNEGREKLEQELMHLKQQFVEQNKKINEELQTQYQSKENQLRQEIEQLKKNIDRIQQDDTQRNELAAKTTEINTLRAELEEARARNDAIRSQLEEHSRQEQHKQKEALLELLDQDIRNQLPNDNQNFNVWFLSFQQTLKSSIESTKQTLQNEAAALKHENDQLHANMQEVESQLKEIEQTIQSKEELLLGNLKISDTKLESVLGENDQLKSEIQRLQKDLNHLQLTLDTATNETRALKTQLEEQTLLNNNSSSTVGDNSPEVETQQLLHSNHTDSRIDQLHELIRSSKEALENQDSVVRQLDKHLNEIRRSGTGEITNSPVDESTVSLSSDQQLQN